MSSYTAGAQMQGSGQKKNADIKREIENEALHTATNVGSSSEAFGAWGRVTGDANWLVFRMPNKRTIQRVVESVCADREHQNQA
jgi:hypothetical protein